MGVRKVMFKARLKNVINPIFTVFNDKSPSMLSVVWSDLLSWQISAVPG